MHTRTSLSVEAALYLNIILRCLEGSHVPVTKCFSASPHIQLLYYCKPLSIPLLSVCVCVCVCNRCIPHLSIITRVNISDDVMVSDRWLICSWAGKRRNQSGLTHTHTHSHTHTPCMIFIFSALLFYQLIFWYRCDKNWLLSVSFPQQQDALASSLQLALLRAYYR